MRINPVSALRPLVLIIVSALIIGAMVASCRATTQNVVTYGDQSLPRPQRVVVYDFTSMPGDVQLQSGLVGRIKEEMRAAEGTSVAEQEVKLQQEIARMMTTQLVQEIRKLGLPVESAATAGPVMEGQL